MLSISTWIFFCSVFGFLCWIFNCKWHLFKYRTGFLLFLCCCCCIWPMHLCSETCLLNRKLSMIFSIKQLNCYSLPYSKYNKKKNRKNTQRKVEPVMGVYGECHLYHWNHIQFISIMNLCPYNIMNNKIYYDRVYNFVIVCNNLIACKYVCSFYIAKYSTGNYI